MDNDNLGIDANSISEPLRPGDEYNTSDAVIKIALVIGAIAYAFSGPVAVTSALSLALLNIFLPGFFEACKTVSDSQGKNIFANINNAILRAALSDADAKAAGLTTKYDIIARTLDTWLTAHDEIKENARLQLVHAYNDLRLVGISEIQSAFYREDFGGFMLHQFVAVSSRYLAAMKDFYTYGVKLKLPVVPARDLDISAILLAQLRKDIGTITEMAVSTYHKGEENIITSKAGYTRSWDDLNAYRTTAIITGLDVVTSFQFLDPLLYPNGCHQRYRNRRLITFLNTSTVASAAEYRAKIAEVDKTLNPINRPIGVLTGFTPYYAARQVSTGHYLSGLIDVICLAKTTDGFDIIFEYARTETAELPKRKMDFVPSVETDLFVTGIAAVPHPSLRATGKYNPDKKTRTGTPLLTCMTKLELQFLSGQELQRVSRDFDLIGYNSTRSLFIHTIPSSSTLAEDIATLATFAGRLSNIVVYRNGEEGDINYVFWWHDKSLTEAMLPERSHRDNQQAIKVEQFHAIRAGMSMLALKHELIRGPGFTGGDLVYMRPIHGALRYPVKWRVQRDPERWFAGAYRVRIWYFNIQGHATFPVQLLCESSGVASRLSLTLSPQRGGADKKDLKYQDLLRHESSSSQVLIITDNMDWIELTFTNYATQFGFIFDRLELIFDRSATLAMEADETAS